MRNKKILIVDDDPRITDLLSDFCADRGYDVKALNDSRLALNTAEEWQPDLITLDLEMPDKDGMEVLRNLRESPKTRNLPVVIISVVAHESAIAPETVQGLFDKPINFPGLIKQIQVLLQPA